MQPLCPTIHAREGADPRVAAAATFMEPRPHLSPRARTSCVHGDADDAMASPMNAWVVGLVLAAAGSAEVEGAVTVQGVLVRGPASAGVDAAVHGRVDSSGDYGRFFVEGHASILFRSNWTGLQDLGSRLAFGYRPVGFVQRLSLEVIPFNPAVRLASFDWANSWGVPLVGQPGLAPLVTGIVNTRAGTAWLSGRFKVLRNSLSQLNEVVPELFAGVDLPLSLGVRLEARGAWLSNGFEASLGYLGVKLPLPGGGGGARLSWTWNEPVGPALDLHTYATDPLRFERFFVTQSHRSPFAAWIALEAGGGTQQLADAARFGLGKSQAMGWVDLQARLRLRDVRLFFTARAQSLTMAVFDRGGLPPGLAFVEGQVTSPLMAGILGADWTFRPLKLTPGVLLRATQPAWVRTPLVSTGGNNPPPGLAPRTLYVLRDGTTGRLGPGKAVAPFLSATVSLRWDVVSFASVVTEIDVEKDLNDYTVVTSESDLPPPTSGDQVTVRGQLMLQARF